MESIILSGCDLKNLDIVDVELKSKAKTVVHIDMSHNILADFNLRFNFVSLQILILDGNLLSTIQNFPIMKNLDTLSVNDNKFSNALEFSMYSLDKFPKLKLLNTLRNPMNPGFNYEYGKYKDCIKKIKSLQTLDGLDVYDDSLLSKSSQIKSSEKYSENEIEENEISDISNIMKIKKRQSTITYSQRMLKKADNLTKFNRKNHSEGNKHITNNDL